MAQERMGEEPTIYDYIAVVSRVFNSRITDKAQRVSFKPFIGNVVNVVAERLQSKGKVIDSLDEDQVWRMILSVLQSYMEIAAQIVSEGGSDIAEFGSRELSQWSTAELKDFIFGNRFHYLKPDEQIRMCSEFIHREDISRKDLLNGMIKLAYKYEDAGDYPAALQWNYEVQYLQELIGKDSHFFREKIMKVIGRLEGVVAGLDFS